jgi:DNA-binding HxlR family transcriptional regulator
MIVMDPYFRRAFASVLAHELDRRILLALLHQKREIRYEALRKTVGEQSSQLFNYAVERLVSSGLVGRRLKPQGKRFMSYFQLVPRGRDVALICASLAKGGPLPRRLPRAGRQDVHAVFLGIPLTDAPVPQGGRG